MMSTITTLLVLIGAAHLVPAVVAANGLITGSLRGETIVPSDQLMSPKYIAANAVITGKFTLAPTYFEISPATGPKFQRALQVQIVPPNLLQPDDDFTVKMTVAMTYFKGTDYDPIFGVSDGIKFVGFEGVDPRNYPHYSTCPSVEGDVEGEILTNVIEQEVATNITSTKYSSEITVQLRPTEQFGACHTEVDEGLVNAVAYKNKLDPSKGIFFQFYHEEADESYRIKYIIIDVELDNY